MKLDVTTLRRISPLLDEALDLEASEREAWLAALSGESAQLAPLLRELLAKQASVETNDLLERGPQFSAPGTDTRASEFKQGDAVGPYRLLRELGHGGMGEVWLAERIDGSLKRQVALKLPSLGLRRAILVQRFERERDILASLSHPNIARLYDAGLAEDDQPYLALEYVEGQIITAYCSANGLNMKQRVGLLLQVTEAVQFAHANLVIHRDLKPGNVLVKQAGQTMLLDFGIAKLLQSDAREVAETELTQVGGRALTLEYAAPEQVSGAPISIATDVYALGVLLHELLTGQRPFKGARRELEDAILTRDPAPLRAVPADLSTIVLKALKKSPAERYATVNAFADDMQRWLKGEPVLAQPDSTWYRARRFTGRHKVAVATTALVAVVIVAASGVSIRQAQLARTEATTAKAVQAFLLDIFNANLSTRGDPLKAQKTTARELLDLGTARIDGALKDSPQSRLEVLETLSAIYLQLGLYDPAADLRRRQIDLARQIFGERDPRLADALLALVETLHEGQRRGQVPALLEQAFAVLDAAGDTRSQTRADALTQAARYWGYESLAEARRSADAAVVFIQAHQPDNVDLVTAYHMAGRARAAALDFAAAEPWYLKSIEAAQRQGDAAPAWLAVPTISLGETQASQLKYAPAETRLRAALAYTEHVNGEGHPYVLDARIRLSNLLLTVGRTEAGLALAEPTQIALATPDARFGPAFLADAARRLAATHLDRGRPDLMVAPLRAEIADLRRTIPNFAALTSSVRQLAEALAALGQVDEAQTLIDDAQGDWQRLQSGEEGRLGATALGVSRAAVALARRQPEAALAALDSALPATPDDRIRRDILRSRALLMLGRPTDALASADAALQAITALPEGGRPVARQAAALLARGQALLATGDAAAAIASLTTALALRRAHDAPASLWHAQAALALADAWSVRGRPDFARSLRAQARELEARLVAANPHLKRADVAAARRR